MTDLNVTNFFKYYIFYPTDRSLKEQDHTTARVASIALLVFTAGIVHIFCAIFLFDSDITQVRAMRKGMQPQICIKKNTKGQFGNITVEVKYVRDICQMKTDAIVNAANKQLVAGSGVCGKIWEQGGDHIFQECREYLSENKRQNLEDGEAMITSGGRLKARHVIHAVGPSIENGKNPNSEEKQSLYNAYFNSLILASDNNLESIAFPSISTGIFNFNLLKAPEIAIRAFKDFAEQHPSSSLKNITMAVWEENSLLYGKALNEEVPVKVAEFQADGNLGVEVDSPQIVVDSASLLLEFYNGNGKDIFGREINMILGWNNNELECEKACDLMHWLFPLDEKPILWGKKAPVLTPELIQAMKSDPVIMANLLNSFRRMLKFYGLQYDDTDKKVIITSNFINRATYWCTPESDHFSYIERILKCLMIFGYNDEATALFSCLTEIKNGDLLTEDQIVLMKQAIKVGEKVTMNTISGNAATLDAYNTGVDAYVSGTPGETSGSVKVWIDHLLSYLKVDAQIIEIGSAFGRDADYIESRGFTVARTDAAQSFVDLLLTKGHSAQNFNILKDEFSSFYDVVFANCVFLHFTREELRNVLEKIHANLFANGILAFSVKIGEGEEWTNEKVGNPRYFCYWKRDDIQSLLESTGFEVDTMTEDGKFLQIISKRK